MLAFVMATYFDAGNGCVKNRLYVVRSVRVLDQREKHTDTHHTHHTHHADTHMPT